jgi:CRISPR-associated protein (TIGR02710 family)
MSKTALLLTVGTGNKEKLEETLYQPLLKSARDGKWALIILLPSQETRKHAEELKTRLADRVVEIHPLPQPWDENAIDSCYRHFDGVIAALRLRGFAPAALTADFTRGTKAMSAALMLAAVRHGVAMTRYIEGDRDDRGMVLPGSEKIRGFAPEEALFARRLDEARALFQSGSFAAVEKLLAPEALADVSRDIHARAAAVRPLAAFCLAWDRLDYQAADAALPKCDVGALPQDWRAFFPPHDVQNWVSLLAEPAKSADKKAMAERTERLIADLLANARRRIAQGQYEDGLIRAYRALELLGQSRLFALGYDSGKMPPEDARVKNFLATLKENENKPQKRDSAYLLAREQVARFLKTHFPDDGFGERLLTFATREGDCIVNRNKSILTHGFNAVSTNARGELEKALAGLERLFRDLAGSETAKAYLAWPRWLDFSPAPE